MRRRRFLALLASAPAAAREIRAQEAAQLPLIAFLSSRSRDESAVHTEAFLRGLGEAGFADGQNVWVEYHFTGGDYDRLRPIAAELVKRGPALLLAGGGAPSALAARAVTSRIPIVFIMGDDPVQLGVVASLNRPGGNVTGVSLNQATLGSKRMELLCELVPEGGTVGLLVNPGNPGTEQHVDNVAEAARALGRRLVVVRASAEAEFDAAFAKLAEERARGLVVQNDPFFDSARERLIALAAARRLAAIYHLREIPLAGGLISYGPSLADAYRLAGTYAARILNGASPAELPVVQPTAFELVINQRTATALALPIPASILARADEVIE